jgi:hypothetical protein
MPRFYQPDLTANFDSPFVRDGDNKLIRRTYWLDMDDRTVVMVMTNFQLPITWAVWGRPPIGKILNRKNRL